MVTGQLFKEDRSQWSVGYSGYFPDFRYNNHNLLVGIKFSFGEKYTNIYGLLDTGSEWVVFSKELVDNFGIELEENPDLLKTIHTRFGSITGYLNRLPLTIIAENGNSLPMQATCLISDHWYGPPVIGWRGCLERIRFALDPSLDIFYFGHFNDD